MNYLFETVRKLDLSEVRLKDGEYRKSFNGFYLDHVFVRDVVVKSAEVIRESEGSDHRPMIIDFRIP
jgi:endonuclease/exonuclease/phosphatase (EEP) superfamily protein YafD